MTSPKCSRAQFIPVLEDTGLIAPVTATHAGDGSGQGPVVLRGMLPPPSLQAVRAVQMMDGEMFHILTMGQGNMSSYAAQIAAEDRWKVIRHVRSLQEASQ